MSGRALTEQEWLTIPSPWPLLEHLRRHGRVARTAAGRRRLRLFGCACCRSAWEHFVDERCRRAVEVSERFADDAAGREELVAGRGAVEEESAAASDAVQQIVHHRQNVRDGGVVVRYRVASAALATTATQDLVRAAEEVAQELRQLRLALAERGAQPAPPMATTFGAEERAQAELVRDLFGNPFRPTSVNPAWLAANDGAVRRLARAIYDERAFDRLPVLADALEEAGCTDADVLGHCRGPGPHARGCWVIDLLRDG
jgi:hypothetical protein